MSGISSGKKWDRPKLIQNFVSSAMGLLVAADVMSLRVPLYFFGQATDRVGDVFHSVARLVRHGLSDIFDQIETGSITVSDALSLVWTAIAHQAKGKDADRRRHEGSELDAISPLRGSVLRANLQTWAKEFG